MTARLAAVQDLMTRLAAAVAPAPLLRTGEPPVELGPDGVVLASEEAQEPQYFVGQDLFEHTLRIELTLVSPRATDADAEAQLDALLEAAHDAVPVGTLLGGVATVTSWETAAYRRERLDGGESVGVLTTALTLTWTSNRAVG